jgi:PAS domain S-box-containing protein
MSLGGDSRRPGPVVASWITLESPVKQGQGVTTYLGIDTRTGERVVVKTMEAATLGGRTWARVQHEAVALRRVRCPYLAPIVDADSEGDTLFLVRPFVPGTPLTARLLRGPLEVGETLAVARCVLLALEAAHEAGVLHRDVSPASVIVGAGGEQATLVDFGLSRSGRVIESIREQPPETVAYMSPEQVGLTAHGVDARSDLYSLGATLYACLAGMSPFHGETVSEVLRKHLTLRPRDVRSVAPAVPGALDAIILRLLKKDPRDRYASAAGVLADIEAVQAGLASGDADPPVSLGAQDRRTALTEPVLVGRERELARLSEAFASAKRGLGGLVLLEAESGNGKTRLLDAFSEVTRGAGGWVLRGGGIDLAATKPFQILDGVVRDVAAAARSDPDLTARLRARVSDFADSLVDTLPALGDLFPAAAARTAVPESHAEERSQAAVAALLDALGSAEQPALVVLDDAQWADEPVLGMLTRWTHSPEATRGGRYVSIVVSFRSEEVGSSHVLRGLESAATIALPPLGARDVRALVESMAGAVPEAAIEAVTRLSGGSPFMAIAVLEGLVENGALVPDSKGFTVEESALAAARSSRQSAIFLARRLETLSPAALRLLGVAAVLGKEFDADEARELAALDMTGALAALDEASRRRLVWSDAHGERFTFVHDKVREALLERFAADERTALHARVAERLEASDPARAYEIAYHFDASGVPARALPYALAAAEQARERHALAVAESQYRIALKGKDGAPAGIQRRLAEGMGDVLTLRGRYDEAEQHFAVARALASDGLARAEVEWKFGDLAFKRGDMGAATDAIERGLQLLGRRAPRSSVALLASAAFQLVAQGLHTLLPRLFLARRPLEGADAERLAIRLYSRLAYAYWFGRSGIACAWAHLCEMNLAERYPETPELAQAYSEHAPVMTMVGFFGRGIAYAERSLAIRRALGDLWGQGQSLSFHGVVLYAASRFRECLEKCQEASRLLERTGDRWEVNTARWHVAYCHYRLGEHREAIREAMRTHREATDIGDHTSAGIALSVWSKASGGRVPAELVQAELVRPGGDRHKKAEVLQAEAVRLLRAKEPDQAVARLEEAWTLVRESGLRQEYVAPILPWLATALRTSAEQSSAFAPGSRAALLKRAHGVARRAVRLARTFRNNLPHALRELGQIEALLGRPRRARAHLAGSLAEAERQSARSERARTLDLLIDVGAVSGWPPGGIDAAAARAELRWIESEMAQATEASEVVPSPLSLAERLAVMQVVGRSIATAPTRDAVLAAVRESALSLLRGESCAVIPVDPITERLLASDGERERLPHALIERAIATRRAARMTPTDADGAESARPPLLRSALCIPLVVRGRVVACASVTHDAMGGLFPEEDLSLAEFLGTLGSAALENVERFAENRALSLELEREKADARFRSLIENASDVITLVDADGIVQYQSPSIRRVLGCAPEAIVGTEAARHVHPGDLASLRARVPTGGALAGPVEVRCKAHDGRWVVLEVTAQDLRDDPGVKGYVLNARDVTDRKATELALQRSEEQLRQSVKMSAIGRLAGGMAHDFNNFIGVVMGFAEFTIKLLPPGHPARSPVERISRAAARSTALTRQLLAFSRRQVLKPRTLDLNELLAEMEPLLRGAIGEGIELRTAFAPGIWFTEADPGQLEQVVLNLALNARDAMPEGGRLTLTTENRVMGTPLQGSEGALPSGDYVVLTVSDTGCGMSPEVQEHLFEPFFTTKPTGSGTGLGLSTAYGIVRQSGGDIHVASSPAQGSSFTILLPRSRSVVVATPAEPGSPPPGGSETILLVEDEEELRMLTRDVLEEQGYSVLEAVDGVDALALARNHQGRIDLLLTDVVMPRMGGPQLATELGSLRRDVRSLFISGYPNGADGVAARSILPKPFGAAALLERVREVLDDETAEPTMRSPPR